MCQLYLDCGLDVRLPEMLAYRPLQRCSQLIAIMLSTQAARCVYHVPCIVLIEI